MKTTMTETRSICPYCGVGCGVIIESDGQQITGIKGDPDHPANFGRLCTKGATLAYTASPIIARQTRLLMPQQRPQRGGPTQPLGWNAALDLASTRLSAIVQQHGADALGVYVSGQLLTEDYYVFNKLVKGLLGSNHIDTNSRLCMSSAVAGYKMTLGADAPPACYEDIDHAQTLFIAGSNTAWAHPILFRRIEEAKARNPAMKIIVADPRRTDTAALADLYLPLQPGTDIALFHGLLHIMLWEGWLDQTYIAAHTSGFEALKMLVRDYTPEHVASVCGLPKADLFTAARWFAGLDQPGVANPAASALAAANHAVPTTGQAATNHAAQTGMWRGTTSRPSFPRRRESSPVQDALDTHLRGYDGSHDEPGSFFSGTHRQPTLSLYCQGLNQSSSGSAKNAALINLHLATGQIGKPGAGPFSLTGQPNAMGGREVGGLANLLSAHRDLANPSHRAEVAALWGVPSVPDKPGRTAIEMFQAAADGEVKALWIVCTNPAQSMPDQTTVRRALQRAEFVMVQEAFAHTATCGYADLLLPATTWGEKEGTVTNSERRISRMRAAVATPVHPDHPNDGPRHDWQIGVQLAQRLEAVLRPDQQTLFPYTSPEQIWLEHRETTRGRDLDITGLTYALLDQHGPQQWPCPAAATQSVSSQTTTASHPEVRRQTHPQPSLASNSEAATLTPERLNFRFPDPVQAIDAVSGISDGICTSGENRDSRLPALLAGQKAQASVPKHLSAGSESLNLGQTRLYTDGQFPTADGRARFASVTYLPLAEVRNARYSFSLITGRLRDQWHGMSRTGLLGRLFGHVPEPTLQMHPQDIIRRGFKEGELVRVSSQRGTLLVPLQASEELAPTQVFMAMHWGSEVLSGQGADGLPLAGVNALTTSAYCPSSKQPEFKHAAVRIDKAELPWTMLGLAWLPDEDAHRARQTLVALMPQLAFATCVPFGRSRSGLLFRAAHGMPPEAALLDQIEAALGLHTPDTLRYADVRLGQRRAVRLSDPGDGATDGTQLQAFLLAGDTRSESWIKTLLQDELPATGMGHQLLRPSPTAPTSLTTYQASAQICTCLNVSEQAIKAHLHSASGSDTERLASLQAALKCGTECGSCRPTLQRLVKSTPANMAVVCLAQRTPLTKTHQTTQ